MTTGAKNYKGWIGVLLVVGLAHAMWAQTPPKAIQNFILKDAMDQTVELNQFRESKAVVVVFTAPIALGQYV